MALMSLFEAPLQMLCDSPTQYLKNKECFKFMAAVPTVWDETIGLAGEVDKFAAIARRKGNVWYVSAIGSWDKQELELPLPFLGEGEWNAEIFEDGVNADRDATDYVRREAKVTSACKLSAKLAPGGGFTARLSKDGGWTESLKFWK
jgi:alpha-glucosidase